MSFTFNICEVECNASGKWSKQGRFLHIAFSSTSFDEALILVKTISVTVSYSCGCVQNSTSCLQTSFYFYIRGRVIVDAVPVAATGWHSCPHWCHRHWTLTHWSQWWRTAWPSCPEEGGEPRWLDEAVEMCQRWPSRPLPSPWRFPGCISSPAWRHSLTWGPGQSSPSWCRELRTSTWGTGNRSRGYPEDKTTVSDMRWTVTIILIFCQYTLGRWRGLPGWVSAAPPWCL